MDFLDALKLLWRRRLIVLVGILLTGLGCGAVIALVHTVYQASAQYLLLLPSKAAGSKNPQNPLINPPVGLILAGSMIAAEINTKDSVRNLEYDGFKSDFEVALAPGSGPVLTIDVTDTDPAAAIAERDEILRRLDEHLVALQTDDIRGIPDNQMIYSVTAAVNQEAEAVPGAKIRALVVVVAVGGLATLLITFLLDGALTRRAIRRSERRGRKTAEKAPEATVSDREDKTAGARRAKTHAGSATLPDDDTSDRIGMSTEAAAWNLYVDEPAGRPSG